MEDDNLCKYVHGLCININGLCKQVDYNYEFYTHDETLKDQKQHDAVDKSTPNNRSVIWTIVAFTVPKTGQCHAKTGAPDLVPTGPNISKYLDLRKKYF